MKDSASVGAQDVKSYKSITSELTPFSCAASVTILAGLVARFWRLGFPGRFSFDEHHFVENARNYLLGKADWNDHPPLGKLTIASSLELLGDSSVGWRFVSALLGSASVVVAFALGRSLFRRTDVGLLAAALVAADGFCIAYSRTALIDGQLTFFALSTVLLATLLTPAWSWIFVGCVAGLAAGVKFSGICLALPLGYLLMTHQSGSGRVLAAALGLVGFVFVYSAQWILGLSVSGKFESLSQVISETVRLYEHHAVLTKMDNPSVSYWYTWFIPTKPLIIYRIPDHDMIRMSTSAGNPLSWWTVGVTALLTGGFAIRSGVQAMAGRLKRSSATDSFDESDWRGSWNANSKGLIVLLLSWAAFLAPWILTKRDSYFYHYLPSYGFGLVLAAGFISTFGHLVHNKARYYFLLSVMVVSGFYAPIWIGVPISPKAAAHRAILRSWR